MISGSSRQLSETLDLLVNNLERLHQEKTFNMDQSSRAVASLDKMTEVLVELERLRAREMILAERFSTVNEKLEVIAGGGRGGAEGAGLVDVLKMVTNGAKVTGQVIEIVAGGFQGIMDSVNKLFVDEEAVAGKSDSQVGARCTPGLDLSSILQPMNSIVQALLSKKSSESVKPVEEVPAGVEEVPAGVEEKESSRPQAREEQQGEGITAPVVKATPAE
jgi:hypothetical protein